MNCVQPLISAAFDRTKITCFAYGQTGSGKTYTMMGEKTVPGLYVMAAEDVFKLLSKSSAGLRIFVSFYEIYCGKLHDLLNDRQQLYAREDAKSNVNIVGLKEWSVNSVDDIMKVIEFGLSVRTRFYKSLLKIATSCTEKSHSSTLQGQNEVQIPLITQKRPE